MENNLVSIIMPVYNAEKYIQESINSIKGQTYKNWELILIDDSSNDKSTEIIERNLIKDKIKSIKLANNQGPANARNVGIKQAKGRYIAFNDSDDIWKKEKLEKQIQFMKNKNIFFCYTGFEYSYEKNTKNKLVKVPYKLEYKNAVKRMKIITSTVIIDTEKIEKGLIKMPNMVGIEDVATWFNIMKKGHMAYGLNEDLTIYRVRKNSLSSNKLRNIKKRWNLYRNNEKFSVIKSFWYIINYLIYAIIKRNL